jgi:hypothetical protein
MLLNTLGSLRSLSIGHAYSAVVGARQSELYGLHWAPEAMVMNLPGRK